MSETLREKTNERQDNAIICEQFLSIIDELNDQLKGFSAKPPPAIKYIYNPTIYASNNFQQYVRKYCHTSKRIMYLGMNPGPWGMSQTGVPFGDKTAVRDWLGVSGDVGKPPRECGKVLVRGMECHRAERSGKRFWGYFRELCIDPNKFHESSFVYNYSPQCWLNDRGANITPGELSKELKDFYQICDRALTKVLKIYNVQIIIAVGIFCEKRAKNVLKDNFSMKDIKIIKLYHPSPRAIKSDKDWFEKATETLKNNDLMKYYK